MNPPTTPPTASSNWRRTKRQVDATNTALLNAEAQRVADANKKSNRRAKRSTMKKRFFAMIMHPTPAPVLDRDGLTIAFWDNIETAMRETEKMPIVKAVGVLIFDLHEPAV